MKASWIVVLVLVAIVAVAGAFFTVQFLRPTESVLMGSMFVSDAGRSHGGFEYNAGWNATLTIRGSTGTLKLVFDVGLGDVLQNHEYAVSDFGKDQGSVAMKLDGNTVTLIWVEEDEVWDHVYDKYYIASWGGDAPPEEIRGTISPATFPGLASQYYVELRLR